VEKEYNNKKVNVGYPGLLINTHGDIRS